ncbi:MAG: hypothetical protein KJ077_22210 [Anaerolineae bacterium]|nr:hypothetical protein [Anaerolineae bacterium]
MTATLSPEKRKQLKLAAEGQIDAFMRDVGYTDPAARTDEQGWRWFQMGSAEGRAGVLESDEGELFLRAEAVVMPLPSDKELILPLMRELLELNLVMASVERLGIKNETVFVSVTRSIMELQRGDFAKFIHSVMATADHLDDILIKKYGGTNRKRG